MPAFTFCSLSDISHRVMSDILQFCAPVLMSDSKQNYSVPLCTADARYQASATEAQNRNQATLSAHKDTNSETLEDPQFSALNRKTWPQSRGIGSR